VVSDKDEGTMYTLYARNQAGSMAVEALLAACGADYKVEVLNRLPDGSFEAFFHAINPKAEVPTLVLARQAAPNSCAGRSISPPRSMAAISGCSIRNASPPMRTAPTA
jgi:hypothetical protein